MTTSNIRHKCKERQAASIKRKRQKRNFRELVLIVCEGETTGSYYFEELRDALSISTANIKIGGSDPISVVDAAITQYQKKPDYDHVYCVFDQDRHDSYQEALDKIKDTRLPKRGKLHAINSVPGFEYWLLLHFTNSSSFDSTKSSCDQVITELNKHLPNYQKGDKGIFEKLRDKTNIAIQNSEPEEHNGIDNNFTQVYELVEYLRNLKK